MEAARAALKFPEIEVVHPLINIRGIGIAGGAREDMEEAVDALAEAGRGVYAMKALGGGHLIAERREAIRYALGLPGVQSVAVGMQSEAEVDYNVALFEGCEPSLELGGGRWEREAVAACGRVVPRLRKVRGGVPRGRDPHRGRTGGAGHGQMHALRLLRVRLPGFLY